MVLLAFGDQLASVQGHIRRLYKRKADTVLLGSFLEKCHGALRDEISQLSVEARASLPAFTSILDLSERYSALQGRRSDIESTLLAIAQLGSLVSYLECNPGSSLTSFNDVVVGYGIGQLCAAAVACASSVLDLVEPAIESVRLAFRIGSVVDRNSASGTSTETASAAWNVVISASLSLVSDKLSKAQDLLNIPSSERPYISISSSDVCTISGTPERLEQLTRQSATLASSKKQSLTLSGLWHSSQLYSALDIENVLSSRLPLLQTLGQSSKQILSTSIAEPIQSSRADEMFRCVISDILTKPVRWQAVKQTLLGRAQTPDVLFGFADDLYVQDLGKALEVSISQHFAVTGATNDDDVSSGTAQTAGDIAIVGMSDRFPGAPDVEAFWKVLEEGRDMHKKNPQRSL